MSLTDVACRTCRPKDKPYKLFDGGGLYLHVMPHGGKYWRYKYRFLNKEKVLALGTYPEISLLEAREKHKQAHKLVANGTDPAKVKEDKKRSVKLESKNTFEVIAREWYEHLKDRWSENHARTVMRRLEQDVFPAIGQIPPKEIKAPILLDMLRAIEKRGAYEMARRALQMTGQILRFAIVTGRAERDVSVDLKGALKPFKRTNYAAMEAKDLPEFLQKLSKNEARLFIQTRLAIELLMLTFVRTSELIKATWSEFDLESAMWIIPAERMKMRKDHMVPLSKQAIAILKQLKELNRHRTYVFVGQHNPKTHMSNNTILMALDRMGYRGIHTGHGFRALAMSTIKEKLGYRHEVIDRQLAHAHRNQIDAAYDRSKFLDERKKMMQEWADYLDAVATGGKIIQFKTA